MKIIKIPFSEGNVEKATGTLRTGAGKAPDAIIEDLNEMHLNESFRQAKYDITEVEIKSSSISENNKKIENAVSEITEEIKHTKERIVILGGSHSITYAAFKGFAKHNPGCGFVLIDAHPDLLPESENGGSEDYLRMLINESIVSKNNVVIAGIRNTQKSEKEYIDANRIKAYTMKHIYNTGINDFCDGLMETVREWPGFYLSIDIDAIDPSSAPGTGCPEPGGLCARELIYVLQRLSLLKNMGIVDIVEVNPEKDINRMTTKLAAKLVKELE